MWGYCHRLKLQTLLTMFLVLDTETTGVSRQDRIVSLCWAIFDASAVQVELQYQVIKPDGFIIPFAAAAVHGISTEQARRVGIPLRGVLERLNAAIELHAPELYVGHNAAFDRPILLNEYLRLRLAENHSTLPVYCTMRRGTTICCLPKRGRGGYKWPKLDELHRHLFGKPHTSAHDARGDVLATAKCFFELRRRGHM